MPKPQPAQRTTTGKRLRRWFLEALLFLLLLYLIHLWQTRDTVQGSAPALDVTLMNGGRFSLEQRTQKPLLVYFWATWCPVCSRTSGSVSALAEEHEVITVAMQSGQAEAVRQHMSEKALQFPVIIDPEGVLAKSWGVRGVPAFFVLDRGNRIRHVSVGYTSQSGLRARLWLAGQ